MFTAPVALVARVGSEFDVGLYFFGHLLCTLTTNDVISRLDGMQHLAATTIG